MMNVKQELLSCYISEGFVKVPELLNRDKLSSVLSYCQQRLSQPQVRPVFTAIGACQELDAVMEDLVSNLLVRRFLQDALGTNYRILSAHVRGAWSGDRRLRMHQDRCGETKISVLISDVLDKRGATVFLPKSHRWPKVLDSFPYPLHPRIIDRKTTAATGRAGDAYIFSGRTWHGRDACGQTSKIALFVSFIQNSVPYPRLELAQNIIQSLGPNLRRLLEPNTARSTLQANQVNGPSSRELADLLTYRTNLPMFSPWHIIKAVASITNPLANLIFQSRGFPPLSDYELQLKREGHWRTQPNPSDKP